MRRLMALLVLPAALSAGELRVGRAAVRITPPPGMPMAGYYYNRGAEGVHDDLHAKAIVLEQDGARAALVACDLANLPAGIVTEARRLITERAGMAGERAIISATHCHTGPLLIGGASRTSNLEGEMLEIARRYAAELPVKIAESVRLAAADLQPARVQAGIGREDSSELRPPLLYDRRYGGLEPRQAEPEDRQTGGGDRSRAARGLLRIPRRPAARHLRQLRAASGYRGRAAVLRRLPLHHGVRCWRRSRDRRC